MPDVIPVFPLTAALLLPRGQMPLNIFEPRYLSMIDHALETHRLIGMIQPRFREDGSPVLGANPTEPPLCPVGCAGRVTAFQETPDGRYLITLTGLTRFRIVEELARTTPYRLCRVSVERYRADFEPGAGEEAVDREALTDAFRAYLDANDMDADWESIERASNEALVNALAMMSPYGAPEKQALLEAQNLKMRAETLIAITELHLARMSDDGASLQ